MPQQIEGDEWSIQFHWLLAKEAAPPVLLEMCFAILLSLARHGTGQVLTPVRVEFVEPRKHGRAIERHFGCPIVFGAGRDALIFRAEDRDVPLVTQNAELLAILIPHFEKELEACKTEDSFTELVRGAIQQRLSVHRPGIEEVAVDLHMSSRTLQRKLREQNTSYYAVLDDVRHRMARQYLRQSHLELNEAAYLLGYEDANSFIRAFRSWEGMPPGQWREAQRANVPLQ